VTPGIAWYLGLSGLLFVMGAVGVLLRRNPLVMLMCIELMLNAVNLTLLAFARQSLTYDGQVFVLITITVAAAEVVVGLAILVDIFRSRAVNADDLSEMSG
jgi:NADH-quinone oxidoreductase subunit K